MITNVIVCHSVPGLSELSWDDLKSGGAHCAVALSFIVSCHIGSRQHGTWFLYGFSVGIPSCSFWAFDHCLGGCLCCLGGCGTELLWVAIGIGQCVVVLAE